MNVTTARPPTMTLAADKIDGTPRTADKGAVFHLFERTAATQGRDYMVFRSSVGEWVDACDACGKHCRGLSINCWPRPCGLQGWESRWPVDQHSDGIDRAFCESLGLALAKNGGGS